MDRNSIKSAGLIVLVLAVVSGSAIPAAALSGLTADFTVTPDDPYVGEDITFDASSTTNVSSNATYSWDFNGDGNYSVTGQTVTHNFSSAGDHEVTLLVEDPDDGSSDTVTKVVSVHDKYSFNIDASVNETGNASALNVLVDGTSQDHDLLANGTFSTTLAEGSVVTVEYEGADGNVTATADYEVGTGGVTALALSDASVDVTEAQADTGGSGTTDSGITLDRILGHWLTQSIVAAFVVYYVFRALELKGDR